MKQQPTEGCRWSLAFGRSQDKQPRIARIKDNARKDLILISENP
jgi:hypothetical protein